MLFYIFISREQQQSKNHSMGAYLDNPVKEKNPESGSNKNYCWGACGM